MSETATEAVDHPAHYGGADNPYEVIKVLENWLSRDEFIGAMKFNIIKYQARAAKKMARRTMRNRPGTPPIFPTS